MAHIWGTLWIWQHVLFHSDNEAVVNILVARTSKVPTLYVSGALVVFKFLDLSIPDHCMLWAACNLAYFGAATVAARNGVPEHLIQTPVAGPAIHINCTFALRWKLLLNSPAILLNFYFIVSTSRRHTLH